MITLEGPTLTWYSRLPVLTIDSWAGLLEKFLLNFQGYVLHIDTLTELSLSRHLERESLHDYYNKFLSLKSHLPPVEDGIAIHYAISSLHAGHLYSTALETHHNPSRVISIIRKVRTIRRPPLPQC